MRTTIILLACLIGPVMSTDYARDERYCRTKLCASSNTACSNNGSLLFCTLKSPKVLDMTKYIAPLTDLFNNLRNDVAGGSYRNLPVAARMAKMSWSSELAWFAHLDVIQCKKTTHQCLSSPNFYYIGLINEEVFSLFGESHRKNLEIMREVIEYWSRDVGAINRRAVLRTPRTFEKSRTLKAALLINERNSRFGCAVIHFRNNEHFIFSCAFATANIVGRPIYKWGLRPGSKCHALDAKFKKLCAHGENYDNHKGNPSWVVAYEEY